MSKSSQFARNDQESNKLTDETIARFLEREQPVQSIDLLHMKDANDTRVADWVTKLHHKDLLITNQDDELQEHQDLEKAAQLGWVATCRALILIHTREKSGFELPGFAIEKAAKANQGDLIISLLKTAPSMAAEQKKWCDLASKALKAEARQLMPESEGGDEQFVNFLKLIVVLERAWGQRKHKKNEDSTTKTWEAVITEAMDAFLCATAPRNSRTIGHQPKHWWAPEFITEFLTHGANPDEKRVIPGWRDGYSDPMTLEKFVGNRNEYPILHTFLDWKAAENAKVQANQPLESDSDATGSENPQRQTWTVDIDAAADDAAKLADIMLTWMTPMLKDIRSVASRRHIDNNPYATPTVCIPIGAMDTIQLPQDKEMPVVFSFNENAHEKNNSSVRLELEQELRSQIVDVWDQVPPETLMLAASKIRAPSRFHSSLESREPEGYRPGGSTWAGQQPVDRKN